MASQRMTLGRKGEDVALDYLEKQGLTLLERNWRSGHLEIDLIMASPGTLHIVEVKTLRKPSPIEPWEHVDRLKQGKLAAAAGRYLHQRKFHGEVQFDIVSILVDGEWESWNLRYIPNAFLPVYFTF